MKRINQNGVAHVGLVVLIVFVVVTIGGVGYYVFSKQQSNTKQTTTTSSSVAEEKKETKKEETDEDAVKRVAKEHFTLVYAKKTEEAYNTTCPQFKEHTTLEKFKEGLEDGNFYKIDLSNLDYTNSQVANNQARISGEVGPLSPNTTLEVDLLKQDGKWCVFGYRTK